VDLFPSQVIARNAYPHKNPRSRFFVPHAATSSQAYTARRRQPVALAP
jgi:hypothetical protein